MRKILIIVAVLLAGCQTALKNMAAVDLGCLPDQVNIVVEPNRWDPDRNKFFIAECNGVKVYCAYVAGQYHAEEIRCKPVK
jgi:hypothetical protein